MLCVAGSPAKLSEHVKESGRVYVLLNSDEYRQGRDQYTDKGNDQSSDLTDELRDRLHYVEEQLEAERQAHAEARRIIAGLVERIPALEAPSEPPQAPETPAEPRPSTTGPPPAETPAEARPWWRRIFRT